ncbi:hypothetical protein BGZ60DRAFT_414976 [Tricladium varicosporioides]|nr:hypothetical protein BGZ60DRAFT_414976 [Hymenoscyphus varicosporioides]
MTRKRFHGLKRVKFRMSWNKYNLYNLSRLKSTNIFGTFFQQKWAAKAASRAYHGEQIREGQWQHMFSSRVNGVIPMDHKYLAKYDGSEQATGRGSGHEKQWNPTKEHKGPLKLPYMQMTYAPIERRLDVAVFRALFASSARQARQFVTHGKVKVNGKTMPYAGYLLNPGDLFSVDPDHVMFASGQPKTLEQVRAGREARRRRATMSKINNITRQLKKKEDLKQARKNIAAKVNATEPPIQKAQGTAAEVYKLRKLEVRRVLELVNNALDPNQKRTNVKSKQRLRSYKKALGTFLITMSKMEINVMEREFDGLIVQYKDATGDDLRKALNPKDDEAVEDPKKPKFDWKRWKYEKISEIKAEKTATARSHMKPKERARLEKLEIEKRIKGEATKRLREALLESRTNPFNETKPYATPWSPRPYLSAFAFIPRYLEVNQKICSAVYLRHPVARPGLAEVPTPFGAETMQLAHNWYLRRR